MSPSTKGTVQLACTVTCRLYTGSECLVKVRSDIIIICKTCEIRLEEENGMEEEIAHKTWIDKHTQNERISFKHQPHPHLTWYCLLRARRTLNHISFNTQSKPICDNCPLFVVWLNNLLFRALKNIPDASAERAKMSAHIMSFFVVTTWRLASGI